MQTRGLLPWIAGLCLGLASLQAGATMVRFSFSGIASGSINSDFVSLVPQDGPVSGYVEFDFSPPTGFNVSGPFSGAVTLGSGDITGFSYNGGTMSSSFVLFDFRGGSGPSLLDGSTTRMLSGVGFRADGIDGFSAGLDDYLALSTANFQYISLIGISVFNGFSISGPITELEVISAGFRRVNAVPAPGLPLPALLVLALITAGAATRRAQRRAG